LVSEFEKEKTKGMEDQLKTKKKLLLVDSVHPIIREAFENRGWECCFFTDFKRPDYERIIGDYDGIIIRSKITLDKDILAKAKKLTFIGRVGAGMESIDVAYAEAQGIACFNSPEGSRDAVGEHCVGLLLNLFRNISKADLQIRNGEWLREQNRGIEIKGKTVGIIGYGNMGSAFAQKISGFGAKVLAYDKYKSNYSDAFVTETDMESIFRETDILSFHVPLTEETTFLFNKAYLRNFKKDIFLINAARGKNVNTSDLVEALDSGRVLGAALDVLEYEESSFEQLNKDKLPKAFQYLIRSDKVVLSSHIAGWTNESKIKLAQVLVDKIIDYLG
jgi:D-3-phosphoglycerate dehydrogenase / 2-oxoglutarate reductase